MVKATKTLCVNCAYWVAVGRRQTGECRRHPPQLNTELALWEFPAVQRESWCGDGCWTEEPGASETVSASQTSASQTLPGAWQDVVAKIVCPRCGADFHGNHHCGEDAVLLQAEE